MTTFHFQTHVPHSGMIAVPPLPEAFRGETVTVKVDLNVEPERHSPSDERGYDDGYGDRRPDPARILPNGKTVIEDFLDYYKGRHTTSLTDEELDELRYEALKEKYGL